MPGRVDMIPRPERAGQVFIEGGHAAKVPVAAGAMADVGAGRKGAATQGHALTLPPLRWRAYARRAKEARRAAAEGFGRGRGAHLSPAAGPRAGAGRATQAA